METDLVPNEPPVTVTSGQANTFPSDPRLADPRVKTGKIFSIR